MTNWIKLKIAAPSPLTTRDKLQSSKASICRVVRAKICPKFFFFCLNKTMKRKNRAASSSTTPPEGKKKKVTSVNDPESSTSATKAIDYTSTIRVVESLLAVNDLESFFEDTWEKKPHFVTRENADFYGTLFLKKDLEGLLKKEEIRFIEDVSLSRYVEGKTELLNEEGRVNLKHIKAAGVAVQFHQPDRFKVCTHFCTEHTCQ